MRKDLFAKREFYGSDSLLLLLVFVFCTNILVFNVILQV